MHLDLVEQRPSRKGKEREPILRDNMAMREPQPTDLDEKLMALRRRTAAATRPRDKSERERVQQQPPLSTSLTPRIERIERSPKMASVARQPALSPRRHQAPHILVSRPSQEADHEEFSRKLKISTSPSPRHAQAAQYKPSPKLFDPDNDPIPTRWTIEPESTSDAAGASGVRGDHGSSRDHRGNAPRQLFDHRKDDPVRFSVLARPQVSGGGRPTPTPKMSGDHVSASSTSSYAASLSSSNFTLSSTTDGSSSSSILFEGWQNNGQGTDDSGNNVFSIQLKKLYRALSNLETKIKQEVSDDSEDGVANRVMLKGKEIEPAEVEREKWKKQINDHKELAEISHNLLEISLSPSVPASLRNIPTKYNIIVRLWTYGFHKLLESLRRASFTSPLALEHLQDFIYYAYTFYTGLLEEPTLNPFKSGWLEALGDLARYRMAVAAMVNGGIGGQGGLTVQAVSEASRSNEGNSMSTGKKSSNSSVKSSSDLPAARIDDSPSPSIGIAAARLLDVEPEKERWRNIAKDWYGAGLAEQPGTGKLHHHLGLLSREVEGEELRGIYHFVKSMTTLHPFSTSRESVLPMWSQAAQAWRSGPDARASELFTLLHGMLFTNIQLDDFQPTLARFVERLEIEGVEEREWIMMAVINVTSVLEYGKPTGVLRRLGCFGAKEGPQAAAMRVMAKKAAAGVPGSVKPCPEEERMDVDDEHHQKEFDRDRDIAMRSPVVATALPDPELPDLPPAFKFALQLTFAVLSHVLKKPTRKASQYSRSTLNPYLIVLLTFLATVLKHRATLGVLERSIPWEDLTTFFTTVPRKIMVSQGLMYSPHDRHHSNTRGSTTSFNSSPNENPSNKSNAGTSAPAAERWVMLTSGCTPPLPEDWCMRGMEWVGRKVFERGYWKSGEDKTAELEVLQTSEGGEVTDGKIEDDDGEEEGGSKRTAAAVPNDLVRRWLRVIRCGIYLADIVDGFNWVDGTREWNVEGKLAEKVKRWKEEDRIEEEEEERRRMGRRWVDDVMDVDEEDEEIVSEDSGDDENDSEEIKGLKARRRYLKSLLQSTQRASPATHRRRAPRAPKKPAESKRSLTIIPGYTILVIDTNILLSSLAIVISLIESQKWTVVIPLPVIMELDGLSSNIEVPQLRNAAQSAMSHISSHIRSHSLSLKVQTSKGNYLSSLAVRTEEVDFDTGDGKKLASKSMDDLILKAAIWQDDHWVDRSSLLKGASQTAVQNGTKVVLLTLDRNLRLKARSRQLPAGGENDLNALALAS